MRNVFSTMPKLVLVGTIFLLFSNFIKGQEAGKIALGVTDGTLTILSENKNFNDSLTIAINGKEEIFNFIQGKAIFDKSFDRKGDLLYFKTSDQIKLAHVAKKKNGNLRLRNIPLWLSIFPPLIAILLALIFKEVVVSLFVGIWTGAFIAGGLRIDSIYYFLVSLFEPVSKYLINALNDSGHLSVMIFSLLIGGMVAIISKNGGMAGVVLSLSKYAKSHRSTQFVTWALGIAIFFDDYANTLIVGNTMRPVTDRFKISREKLAYIVDSTAAPVAAVAFITTWIGAELGYIDSGLKTINLEGNFTPYSIFIQSLKYSFYPILALSFILMLIYQNKDFGPMYKAEKRAKETGQVSSASNTSEDEPNMEDLTPVEGAPLKWQNAVFPVLTVIFLTIFGLVDTGMSSLFNSMVDAGMDVNETYSSIWKNIGILNPNSTTFFTKLGDLIGSADSYVALLWASVSGVTVAVLMTLANRIMNLKDTMHWLTTGFKTMLPALIILALAWSLAITTNELHTADYLSSTLVNTINPYLMPVIIFILAALISFSTGSSWSTMAILYPIAIPTTYAISLANGLSPDLSFEILLNVIATVLAASVLGDHCSPISDTTILSSLASDCNHIDHVRTQMPYALTVGFVSMVMVGLSTFLGGGWLISFILLVIALCLLYFIIYKFGKSNN